MEAGKTDITYGQKMTALNELLTKVTDRRTIVEFTIAEKIEHTYRIKASSWKDAKEKYAVSSDDGCFDSFATEEELEENKFFRVDGSHCYVNSYAPKYEQKIKQVKIRHQWFDLDDLESDPIYYLQRANRWD
jgi:hypothetical protein